jgi:hypothetical protein
MAATDDLEWICRADDVTWGPKDGLNPGCWICGSPGEGRPTGLWRLGLPQWGGYGPPSAPARRPA